MLMNHRNLLTKKQQQVMSDFNNTHTQKHIEVKQYFLIKITTIKKVTICTIRKTIFAFKLF